VPGPPWAAAVGSHSEPASTATSEFRFGWAVRPESDESAASTTSTPALAASRIVAAATPEVSWVWRWTGMPTASLSAFTSFAAAKGLRSPAMSFTARKCAPIRSSSFASFT